jgi:hypothetical protein
MSQSIPLKGGKVMRVDDGDPCTSRRQPIDNKHELGVRCLV